MKKQSVRLSKQDVKSYDLNISRLFLFSCAENGFSFALNSALNTVMIYLRRSKREKRGLRDRLT